MRVIIVEILYFCPKFVMNDKRQYDKILERKQRVKRVKLNKSNQ